MEEREQPHTQRVQEECEKSSSFGAGSTCSATRVQDQSAFAAWHVGTQASYTELEVDGGCYSLSSGAHSFTVKYRERDAQLDSLSVRTDFDGKRTC